MRCARPSRRLAAALVVAGLLAAVPATPVAADDQLSRARHHLQETKERIRAQLDELRDLQRELNRLATRITANESLVAQAREEMAKLKEELPPLRRRYALLRARLDARSREAYMQGPGPALLYLITATSVEDAVNRITFLDEMNLRDAQLAEAVGQAHAQLLLDRARLDRFADSLKIALLQLRRDRKDLQRGFKRAKDLLEKLRGVKEDVLYEISRIHPFAVCPVDGPHAIANDFGIWVHHPKKEGGDHIHQGNDISAPMGTPIVAPFDGLAVTARNKIGGLAVKVFGKFGYVYNAHLSRYGTLGEITKGTVIGYVGATGNAGGPHDHFEWHPGNGDAVDPYGFLMQVC